LGLKRFHEGAILAKFGFFPADHTSCTAKNSRESAQSTHIIFKFVCIRAIRGYIFSGRLLTADC
jgi:hypothetical protein